MDLGYVTPNSWGVDATEVIELGLRAEELGAASLWVSHHVLHVGGIEERLGTLPYHDPFVTLAGLATRTTTARLGTSIMVLPYLHPIITAKTVATIDHLSKGRMVFGVGVGAFQEEHDGIAQSPFARRGRYADEFLDIVKLLWSGGHHSHAGEFFTFEDLAAYPGPYLPTGIPILVGGRGEAAMARTVKYADSMHAIGLEPDEYAASRAKMLAALAAAGRSTIGFTMQLRLHIDITALDVGWWQDKAAAYEAAGVDELILAPQSTDAAAHRTWIETLVPALAG